MKLSSPIYKLKRQAKLRARNDAIKLHQALDQIAISEGFTSWSHMATQYSKATSAKKVLEQIEAGDMVLIAARRGHGKTLLALELAALAALIKRNGHIFTLEYNESEVWAHLERLGFTNKGRGASIIDDASNDICSSHIITHLRNSSDKALIVIDYLQLLDQKRSNPSLEEQLHALKQFASETGAIVVIVSQINRAFELSKRSLPTIDDIRLPNPVDLSLFDKRCFLHDGRIQIERAA